MTTAAISPLLLIPPFPNSRFRELARPAPRAGPDLADDRVDAIALALAKSKVGGDYWAARPQLPDIPYTLVRTADRGAIAQAAKSRSPGSPMVLWVANRAAWLPEHGLVIEGSADAWHMVSGAAEVVADADDELALISVLAGVPLRTLGDGHFQDLPSGGQTAMRTAVRQLVTDGFEYVDPFTEEAIGPEDAIDLCSFWRELILHNQGITAAVGFGFWKRPTVAPLLWNGASNVPFTSRLRPAAMAGKVAVWKSRTDAATLAKLMASETQLLEVEDGFIRSAGLGADCVPPLSIVVDGLGIYFDPNRASDLERFIQDADFTPDLLDRARRLRELIVRLGISKYGAGLKRVERRAGDRRHILVPGQVEDDRSVLLGGGAISTNLELLRRVRYDAPDAYIIYKPHPDVEAGHRTGSIADSLCLSLADEIVRDAPITALVQMVDEVHVNTSLAGFEALLRGKAVTVYGVPFYAGWGLTRDLGAVPERRTAVRTLDEVVAAALLLYPRYLDPVTGLPCPPEVVIRRLADGRGQDGSSNALVGLRRLQGRLARATVGAWAK